MTEHMDPEISGANERDRLLTAPQAAKLAQTHENTIRNWIYKGLLPAQKVGIRGRLRIRRSDLEAALTFRPLSEDDRSNP